MANKRKGTRVLGADCLDTVIEQGMTLHVWSCDARPGVTAMLVTDEDNLLLITDYIDDGSMRDQLVNLITAPSIFEAMLLMEDKLQNVGKSLLRDGEWWKSIEAWEQSIVRIELTADAVIHQLEHQA